MWNVEQEYNLHIAVTRPLCTICSMIIHGGSNEIHATYNDIHYMWISLNRQNGRSSPPHTHTLFTAWICWNGNSVTTINAYHNHSMPEVPLCLFNTLYSLTLWCLSMLYCIITVAQRVVAKGNWHLLDRNVKVTLALREPDSLEELLQTYSPACTVVLRGIPAKTTHKALQTHIAANTHLEEGEDYELEESSGTALVRLEEHCECMGVLWIVCAYAHMCTRVCMGA